MNPWRPPSTEPCLLSRSCSQAHTPIRGRACGVPVKRGAATTGDTAAVTPPPASGLLSCSRRPAHTSPEAGRAAFSFEGGTRGLTASTSSIRASGLTFRGSLARVRNQLQSGRSSAALCSATDAPASLWGVVVDVWSTRRPRRSRLPPGYGSTTSRGNPLPEVTRAPPTSSRKKLREGWPRLEKSEEGACVVVPGPSGTEGSHSPLI